MIVDVHHHLLAEHDYVGGLLAAMDRCGVDLACVNGLGLPSDNSDVERALARHGDRLVGFGVIRLGDHGPDDVRRLRDRGFVGLKTTRPRRSYDDPRYDEVYAAAAELRMPVLFHTGLIVGVPADRTDDVSSTRCRPVALDRVARTFPDLVIVMAHLGMPWHEEAAQMCRFHGNVYVDLSGALEGWRNRKSPEFFTELFYWPDAFRKILFGSDVHHGQLADALSDYRRILSLCEVPDAVAAEVLGGTVERILRLDPGGSPDADSADRPA